MKNIIKFLLKGMVVLSFFTSTPQLIAQQTYRIKTEYSIKYKDIRGNEILQMGSIFYDMNNKIVVMKNGFPVREILAHKDTTIYQIRNNKLLEKHQAYSNTSLTIFHLALSGKLNNFGLDDTGYHLVNVKSDKGLILTTWSPPDKFKDVLGKILVSTKNKQLFGIVFLDKNENIVAKHFYRNYRHLNGFTFPSEVLRITYEDGKESYKLTKYKNIRINETSKNEEYYNFVIPDKRIEE